MKSPTLNIHVKPDTAEAYESASAEERRKLDDFLGNQLEEAVRDLPSGEASGPAATSGYRLTGRELLESGLVGLWRDHPEARDSVAFAHRLREKAQRR